MNLRSVFLSAAAALAPAMALAQAAAPAASAQPAAGQCAAARPLGNPLEGAIWNGWGVDATNSRFQNAKAAGLQAQDIPRLKLKWAFGFPNATSAFAQPTLAAGRVFVGSQGGSVYSLDAATGCTYWTYAAGSSVRTAPSIAATAAAPSGYAVYFGDIRANIHAVDAASGQRVWMQKVDNHQAARITGAPTLAGDRLVVNVSSLEEGPGGNANYECCTFRGSILVLDINTGKQFWKTYTIPQEPRPTKKNKDGVTQWGPSGAAVWSAPTVDVAKGIIYVATGNAYSEPAADTTDAVMALDLKTGKVLWSKQVTSNDVFVVGCGGANATAVNCAAEPGPDYDFGNSPILRTLPGGRQVLVIGQKAGVVHAMDPAKQGETVWQFRAGKGSALGGMEWGSAADDQFAYIPLSDVLRPAAEQGGLWALRLTTGEQVWQTPSPAVTCPAPRGCNPAQSAAISVIPGAVFSGALNGYLRAYSTTDGKIIWEFNTWQDFKTVNGVPAKGGSINAPGPTIAGGMVFTNSGYGQFGGVPGNVLLAFGVE
jgi:polyvinyl alcohol dehydrogenase (cytochrome)